MASVSICPLFPPVPCWPLPSSHPRTPFRPHLQIINMISKSLDHVYAVVHWQVLQSTPSPPPLAIAMEMEIAVTDRSIDPLNGRSIDRLICRPIERSINLATIIRSINRAGGRKEEGGTHPHSLYSHSTFIPSPHPNTSPSPPSNDFKSCCAT